MVFVQHYDSPLGPITLACDETAIIGLWFDGQKYFGNILPEQLAEKDSRFYRMQSVGSTSIFPGARRISHRRFGMILLRFEKWSATSC